MSAAIEQRNQDATCYTGNLDPNVTEALLWEVRLAFFYRVPAPCGSFNWHRPQAHGLTAFGAFTTPPCRHVRTYADIQRKEALDFSELLCRIGEIVDNIQGGFAACGCCVGVVS